MINRINGSYTPVTTDDQTGEVTEGAHMTKEYPSKTCQRQVSSKVKPIVAIWQKVYIHFLIGYGLYVHTSPAPTKLSLGSTRHKILRTSTCFFPFPVLATQRPLSPVTEGWAAQAAEIVLLPARLQFVGRKTKHCNLIC